MSPSSPSPPDLSRRLPSTHRARPSASSARSFSPLLSTWHCNSLPANIATKKNNIIMDPIEDLPPPPAFSPPPAPSAIAPPPAPAAAFHSGTKIFVLSPLPSNKYDVDRYCYSPAADVSEGDYAALLTFAAHYGHPLAILHCPDIAAFQVSHLLAIICPFSEVPPPIL